MTEAFLPPAGAPYWVRCASWASMHVAYPTVDSWGTLERKAAHWVLGESLQGVIVPEGEQTPQGVPVSIEMLEGVDLFLKALGPLATKRLHIDESIHGGRIHPMLNWGAPDVWHFEPPYLDIFGYVFQHGYVDEVDNWELINYASLILETLGLTGAADLGVIVRMHVVQPRHYSREGPIRTWTVPASDLRAHFNILTAAAIEATGDRPVEAVAGPTQCEHCAGRHACQTLQRAAARVMDETGRSPPIELSPEAAGVELQYLRRARAILNARLSGREEQVLGLIRNGVNVPHWMVESTPGREAWTRGYDEVVALGQMMGIPLAKPALITPAQARNAGLDETVVAQYSNRPKTSSHLVEDTGAKAARTFTKDSR